MRSKKVLMLGVLLFTSACSILTFGDRGDEEKAKQYSQVEITLSDFSKKITGYYAGRNQPIPQDFDASQFIAILEQIYPDKDKVKLIKDGYKLSVRHVDDGYSAVLCDRESSNKLMEDIASPRCSLSKVEVRYWDKPGANACSFEENWLSYCK